MPHDQITIHLPMIMILSIYKCPVKLRKKMGVKTEL